MSKKWKTILAATGTFATIMGITAAAVVWPEPVEIVAKGFGVILLLIMIFGLCYGMWREFFDARDS